MKLRKKVLAILLSIAMVTGSTVTLFAENGTNGDSEISIMDETTSYSTTINEPTITVLSGADKSTPSIVGEEENGSAEDEEMSISYEEEPEEDATTISEEQFDETIDVTSLEDENGESESITEGELVLVSELTIENVTTIDSESTIEIEPTVDSSNNELNESASEITETFTSESSADMSGGKIIATDSEVVYEEMIATTSVISDEELFGVTAYWVYYYIDDSDMNNITIHYSGTEPTGYEEIDYNKKGSVEISNISSPLVNNLYKESIKTAVFDDEIDAKTCNAWFKDFTSLTTIENINNLNTNIVPSMKEMFCGCTSLVSIDVSSFTNNQSTDFSYMFKGCSSLVNVNINGLFPSSVININASWMFSECSQLQTINLANVNMSTIKNMARMFNDCTSLTSIDFSNSNVGAVTSISYIFRNCSQLVSLNLNNFGALNITNKSNPLQGCDSIRTIYISESVSTIVNTLGLKGNWKKSTSDTIYEYSANRTAIPAEAGEYVRMFKITFDSNGGNAVLPIFREYNGSVTLQASTRQGFTFDGWFTNIELTTAVTSPFIIQSDSTIYAKWSGGEGATLVYWGLSHANNNSVLGRVRFLQLSMNENSISSSCEYKGSFSNTADFNSETDVPWHNYRSEIEIIDNYGLIQCKSCAYWFKDCIKILNSGYVLRKNYLLENIEHIYDGCTRLTSDNQLSSPNLKNMQYAFRNCSSLRFLLAQNRVDGNEIIVRLDANGFKGAFDGCTNLKRLQLSSFDFSNYSGDISSFSGLTKLVKIRVRNSGNLFNRVGLIGEWWEYDSGSKYTSDSMPTNVRVIRKFEDCSNKIYWYYANSSNDEIHLTSTRPNNSNYKDGHYFNGDESTVNALLPMDQAENTKIVLDNSIKIRNDAGDYFFECISSYASEIVNLNYLNTSDVTSMIWMFAEMPNIQRLNLSTFNTSKVKDMSFMFYNCPLLEEVDLSSFSTSSLKLNEGCNYDGIASMFYNCGSLRTIYAHESFEITYNTNIQYAFNTFDDCISLVGGNGTIYSPEHVKADYARIDSTGTPGYFTYGGAGPVNPSGGSETDDDGSSDGESSDGESSDGGDSDGESSNGGSSSGSSSSGGSGGSGGGSIASIDNQINNAMSRYVPLTTQVAIVKSITDNNSLNGNTSTWSVDSISGKWKLSAVNANGQAVSASNGFYAVNKLVTTNVYGNPVTQMTSTTYYFDSNGDMVTGWVQTSDNKWYFFDNAKTINEGAMVTGWKMVQNQWYYFGIDGAMYQNTITPDGYRIDENGHYISELLV